MFTGAHKLPVFLTLTLGAGYLFLFKGRWLVLAYSNLLKVIQMEGYQDGNARFEKLKSPSSWFDTVTVLLFRRL